MNYVLKAVGPTGLAHGTLARTESKPMFRTSSMTGMSLWRQ